MPMNSFRKTISVFAAIIIATSAHAQFDESGISAGFFDSSKENNINFSEFHLPPLAVLFENAKSNPNILSLAKAQEIAQAEVAKQKRHIFSYVTGHASYSYGVTDSWGQSQNAYNATRLLQFQGSEQSYWNVGVNLAVPLEDILDLKASVNRKKLEVDKARLDKDIAYENLKLEIGKLYATINNNLIALKTASENAAIYQGAGALNLEDFHYDNMSIEEFAWTKTREEGAVSRYQNLQTQLVIDIMSLEIMTRTPILTNATTEITLDSTVEKSKKQIEKENKANEKRIKKSAAEEDKRLHALEKAEKKAAQKDKKNKKK